MSHVTQWLCLNPTCRAELGLIERGDLVVAVGLAITVRSDGTATASCRVCGETRVWEPRAPPKGVSAG